MDKTNSVNGMFSKSSSYFMHFNFNDARLLDMTKIGN